MSTNLLAFVTAALGYLMSPSPAAALGSGHTRSCTPYADRKSLLLYGVNLQIVSRFGTEGSEVQIQLLNKDLRIH